MPSRGAPPFPHASPPTVLRRDSRRKRERRRGVTAVSRPFVRAVARQAAGREHRVVRRARGHLALDVLSADL